MSTLHGAARTKTHIKVATFKAPRNLLLSALVLSAAVTLAGCKQKPLSDDQLASKVQQQLAADNALTGQTVQPVVAQGVVTLNGSVANDAQRTIAARDAAGVTGVVRVINSISLGNSLAPNPNATASTVPAVPIPVQTPPPVPASLTPRIAEEPRDRRRDPVQQPPLPATRQPAPVERQPAYQPPSQPVTPPPPPAPTFRTVTLAAGSTLPVRITQTLSSATTQAGSTFSGTIESNVMADGAVIIPAGSTVSGIVSDVKDAAHFKGASLLSVQLSTINRRGGTLAVETDPYTVTGKGRGTNTAEKVGGGAAVGAILGGILGGGKGAAIGAAAGGGTGAGVQAITRGQQVQIPSETVVRFHLASPISAKVRNDGNAQDSGQTTSPGLSRHDQ